MGAGDSARSEANSLARAAERLRAKADYLEAKAAAYDSGADGEIELVEHLAPLGREGYVALADLGIPGRDSNIDLVLVGPPGVFVLDAKRWNGHLSVDGLVLRQNGRRRAEVLEHIRLQSAIVAEVLDGVLPGRMVPTWPIVAFVGEGSIGGHQAIDRVHLADRDAVMPFMRSIPAVLTDEEVGQVREVISDRLAERTATAEHGGDDGSAVPPPEPVVFLTRWNRFGKRRLYVRDELGIEGGHLDLVSGTVVGTTPAANAVLAQLLVHYAAGDSPEALTDDDRRSVAQMVASMSSDGDRPTELELIAGVRWANHGRQRLYVHRLRPGGKKFDLGWVDLQTERVHADVPGTEPVIRYCGVRYRSLATTN